MSLTLANYSRPLRLLRILAGAASLAASQTQALIGASATVNLLPIWSCLGWGTLRVYAESDVAGTLNIFQKLRNETTFRQTDPDAVAAATVLSTSYLITGEHLRIQYVNGGTIQARFSLIATLIP